MSEYRNKYDKDRKKRAEDRVHSDPHQKVDASDWKEAEPLDAETKVGMRPISERQFKRGGHIGEKSKHHAGRKPRKSGGRALTANSLINRDQKEANKERSGDVHVGGYKRGGRPKKMMGGPMGGSPQGNTPPGMGMDPRAGAAALMNSGAAQANVPTAMMAFGVPPKGQFAQRAGIKTGGRASKEQVSDLYDRNSMKSEGRKRKSGGRSEHPDEKEDKKLIREMVEKKSMKRDERKSGGRTGKTNVNIIIADKGAHPQAGQPGGMPASPPPGMPKPPPPMPAPGAPPMGAGAPMPMPPPGMMPPGGMPPGGPPMMPRKHGGRAYPLHDAGAGGGEGRLQKARAYGLKK